MSLRAQRHRSALPLLQTESIGSLLLGLIAHHINNPIRCNFIELGLLPSRATDDILSDSHLNLSILLAQSLRSSGTPHDLVLMVDPSCKAIHENQVIHEHYDEMVVLQNSVTAVEYTAHLGFLGN
ncbi:hypothetical protein R1sor_003657 [Riccia sorocarpa]|uniref:Uncharacterized protein n=1 Tax=Riccia sorocarpa TaxID=122646 RepID=A0ABD3H280_9MARC